MKRCLLALIFLSIIVHSSAQEKSIDRPIQDSLPAEDSMAYRNYIRDYILQKVPRKQRHLTRTKPTADHLIIYYFIGQDTVVIHNITEVFNRSSADSSQRGYYHYGYNFKDGKVVSIAKLDFLKVKKNKSQKISALYFIKDDKVVFREENNTQIDWQYHVQHAYELKEGSKSVGKKYLKSASRQK